MKKTFYSNGKLLITAEYLVLDGAKALALPTKFGQDLVVENGTNKIINWKSFDKDGTVWFVEKITFSEIINKLKSENQSEKNTLIDILHQAYLLNPEFINSSEGYIITTHLTFPKFWGLGTSSTLINNIAQWLEIDAFKLLKNSFGGSGYDIACAQNDSAIFYQLENGKPIVQPIDFKPECSNKIYFVYLNKKQSSKNEIATYYKKQKKLEKIIPEINNISEALVKNPNFDNWADLIKIHENILSEVLEEPSVKSKLFLDFNGSIKSLGAWGGDFIMVISKENPTEYFKEKGFETVISYEEMIL